MRVLFLAHAYPRHDADPVGSFVGNLAVALRDRGVDVTVSAPSATGLAPFERVNDIPVHRFRYAPDRYETLAYTGTMGAQVRDTLSGKVAMLSYLASAFRAARELVATRAVRSGARALVVPRWAGGIGARARHGASIHHHAARLRSPTRDDAFPSGARCSGEWRGKAAR